MRNFFGESHIHYLYENIILTYGPGMTFLTVITIIHNLSMDFQQE
jgi:hypothetical protein